MNRGCICPTCLHGSGVIDWVKRNYKPILGTMATLGAIQLLGKSSYRHDKTHPSNLHVSIGSGYGDARILPFYGKPFKPVDLTKVESMYGSGFVDWVKKNSDVIGDTLFGAVSGGLNAVPSVISKHYSGQTIKNLQNQINLLKNR